jgi:hypothetical protein
LIEPEPFFAKRLPNSVLLIKVLGDGRANDGGG